MSADMTKLVKLSALDNLASLASAAINDVASTAADAIKKVAVSGSTINFYKNKNAVTGTDAADFTVDFPSELVLDAANTTFEPNFAFSTATYGADTSNPNLDGKPVLVLGVKTTAANGTTSTTYSFLNLYDLVDIYTIKAGNSSKVLAISGKEIEFKVSAVANNAITVQDDGIHVDISGKQDKDTDAVENNIAKFDANGNAVDTGIAASSIVLTSDIASDSDVSTVLATYFPQS